MKIRLISAALLSLVASLAVAAILSSTLTWTAPTGNTDGTVVSGTLTYNVYEGSSATTLGTTPIQTGVATLTAASTVGATPGASACFAVTAVEGGALVNGIIVGGQESAQSNVLCKTFPKSTPNAPVLTSVN